MVGSVARSHGWLVFLGVGGATTVGYAGLESIEAKTAAVLLITGAGLAALVVGIRIYRPRPLSGWLAVAGALAVWFAGWIFWQSYILDNDGLTPALSSWRNVVFLFLYPFFVGAFVDQLRRREDGIVALVDTAILSAGLVAVAWVALIHRYTTTDEVSVGVAIVQILFATGDVLLLAVMLRATVSPGRRPPAFWLLLAGGLAFLSSNAVWNWSSQLGDYAPGSWADSGWLLFPIAAGAAALHPSMRTALAPPEVRVGTQLGWNHLGLLLAAVLVAPTLVALRGLEEADRYELLVVAAAAAAAGVLVVVRLALTLHERQRLAAVLERQNRELLHLDRMKDEFVASVSHELRTPLTSIQGYLELVLDGEAGELTDEQRQFLGVVDRNADRLLRVVGDLLFVAQVDAGALTLELDDVDPSALVRHAVEAARPSADRRGVALQLELGAAPRVIEADRARLAQALDNLVSNAIKFTPPGGTVQVAARATSASSLEISVRDNGPGIEPDDLERLFERFYRTASATEQAVPGTGLGLPISKAIVEAHGGRITVESRPGTGAAFRIVLPLRPADATRDVAAVAGRR